jgi:dolichol-phosphate mannosyltransferase
LAKGIAVRPSELTVVIATSNERENLPIVLFEIEKACGPLVEIVIVDDESTDGTREILRSAAQANPHLRFLQNEERQTIVKAHMQGIAQSETPYVVLMDADLQHPPEAIPRILGGLRQGYDVVVATRFGKGGHSGSRTAMRGLISRIAAFLIQISIVNTRQLTDPTSGFFGIRRLTFEPDVPDLRGYETLVFVLAMMKQPRIAEVPYGFRERGSGESKVLRGFSFLRVFFIQLVVAKRLELATRKEPTISSGSGLPQMTAR